MTFQTAVGLYSREVSPPPGRLQALRAVHTALLSRRLVEDIEAAETAQLESEQELLAALARPSTGRLLPPPPCAFLKPGQEFEGRQRVAAIGARKNEQWGVHVTIQGYDHSSGYVCGVMEASNVPDMAAPVTTFFEGEVVDNLNHCFITSDWAACTQTDLQHWTRLPGFSALHTEVVQTGGWSSRLAAHPYVYMRWKEQHFIQGSESRLTIAGFYYIAVHRASGEIRGLYYDPSSTPDQKLELEVLSGGEAGHVFAHYDLA